jgi:hypothetical protein
MRFVRLLALVFACALLSGACAKRQARVEPVPPLAVPDAPPRVIAPAQLPEPVEEIAGPPEPAPAPAQPPRKPPARPAPKQDAKEEPQKPEPVAETPADAPPAPTLRTPQTANDQAADRRVRDTLQGATRTLSAVDYSGLNPNGKSQYDTAKRFIEQAEEALKNKNYVFATYLSEKADTLARGLQGR